MVVREYIRMKRFCSRKKKHFLIFVLKFLVTDSNSDNNKLSTAANKFERALDKLIESEEQKRICYV